MQHRSPQGPKLLPKKHEVSQGNKIQTHILTSVLPFPSSFPKIRLLYSRSDFNKTNAAFLTVSLKAKKEPEKHFSGQNHSLILVSIHFPTFAFCFLAFWNLYSFFLLIRTLVRDFTRAVLPQRGGLPGPHAVQARLLSVSQKRKWGLRATGGPAQRPVGCRCAWETARHGGRGGGPAWRRLALPTLPVPWDSLSAGLTLHWAPH